MLCHVTVFSNHSPVKTLVDFVVFHLQGMICKGGPSLNVVSAPAVLQIQINTTHILVNAPLSEEKEVVLKTDRQRQTGCQTVYPRRLFITPTLQFRCNCKTIHEPLQLLTIALTEK